MKRHEVKVGDCLSVMRQISDNTFDSVVTDPPYGISISGQKWETSIACEEVWREALRVSKPGAHLLAFGGTRTFHRLTCAIEDAGWEIRDCIMWVYGSGFPKSLDVSKAIDKAAGAEREVVGEKKNSFGRRPGGGDGWGERIEGGEKSDHVFRLTAPATDLARQWQGWGTAIKPAWEPIIVARKPLDGTVAGNVAKWGTGGLNVDGCRVETGDCLDRVSGSYQGTGFGMNSGNITTTHPSGRFPANLVHDGSEEACAGMGRAERFFYCAKASRGEREAGLTDAHAHKTGNVTSPIKNHHPTVKPVSLMRWLVRLITPPGGRVLDPFCGSGSTGKACVLEGARFTGIEVNPKYAEIARARIAHEERLRRCGVE